MEKTRLQHMIIAEVVRARNGGLSSMEVFDAVHEGLEMTQHLSGADIIQAPQADSDISEA